MNTTMLEMKNTLDGIISRPEMTEGKTEKLKTEIQAIQRGIFLMKKVSVSYGTISAGMI